MNIIRTDLRRSNARRAMIAAVCVWAWVSVPVTADQTAYWRTTPPGGASPSAPGSGWTSTGGGNFTLTLAPGASLWIGLENFQNDNEQKSVNLRMNQVTGDPANPDSTRWLEPREIVGVRTGQPNISGHAAISSNIFTASPPFRRLFMVFEPCPEWEYVRFENISSVPRSFRLFLQADSECSEKRRAASVGLPSDWLEIESGSYGIGPELLVPQRITQIEIYPEHVPMDLVSAPPVFVAPAETGNWAADPSFLTPFGDPKPEGGYRFFSDGDGLLPEHPYDLQIKMDGMADAQYSVFAFNAETGQWRSFLFDLRELPWREDFDLYTDGNGCIGQGDWIGWDDDPAFDAPVTGEQARSGANSVKVDNNADLVRPFEGADSGFWTFEAWQYIPSDFTSAGGGQFAGSYFNLLNTYTGTIGSNWSVQIQADSNDGMLKVFHGDGTNTIGVPYEVDRWVKIQVDIDLENDWTQVYYDDSLVTEYSWTSGVLGEGGGAPEIAAVDLFAQGSSPVFYDDLVLMPVQTHCAADLAEPFGSLDFSDVVAFLVAFGALEPSADLAEPFGQWDFSDVAAYLAAFGEGCP